ncbi:MAG: hypothetical protein ACAH80_03155 [Alphaproteobacteria bacterium]
MKLRRLATYELSALAVIGFIIDHYGSAFFPQEPWMRQLKFCALFWFFPCGYNSGWQVSDRLWMGLVLVTAANVFAGLGFFPLNALATLIAIKYLLDPMMEFCTQNPRRFLATQAALVLLIPSTFDLLQFGTLGFIIAEAGWLVRHRDRLVHGRVVAAWFLVFMAVIFAACLYIFLGQMDYAPLWIAVSIGVASWYMWDYRGSVMEAVRHPPKIFYSRAISYIGHHSLEIFVAHMLIIRALGYFVYGAH